MGYRKYQPINGQYYHVFNKSIAGYVIFNSTNDFHRMVLMMRYFQWASPSKRFSKFIKQQDVKKDGFINCLEKEVQDKKKIVEIAAYCLMPTHVHLLLKQLEKNGISIYMKSLLNSYSLFFNRKCHRRGPLWVGRYKNILVDKDETLLHLTRYIHLNPVTAYLTHQPELWIYSSYREYLNRIDLQNKICRYSSVLDIVPEAYQKFVENQTSYQRELSRIKKLILE